MLLSTVPSTLQKPVVFSWMVAEPAPPLEDELLDEVVELDELELLEDELELDEELLELLEELLELPPLPTT